MPTIIEIVAALDAHQAANERAIAGKKNDPRTRARIMTDLALCKIMGLSYDDIRAFPRAVYEVLVEDLAERRGARTRCRSNGACSPAC